MSTKDRCRVISALALLNLVALAVSAGAAQFLKISIELEVTSASSRDSDRAAASKSHFISALCIAGTNTWRIEDDFVRGGKRAWFFDGTNVYHSLRRTEPMPDEARERFQKTTRLAVAPFEEAQSVVSIHIWPSDDGCPMGDVAANLPWLAFCSGSYLARPGRLVPLAASLLRHTRDRFAFTDKTTLLEGSPGLPRTIDLYTSRSLFLASEQAFDREAFFGDRYTAWVNKTAASLREGVHTFHYEVLETTNVLGWRVPTKFEYVQYPRAYEPMGDWTYRGIGRVKSIRATSRPEGLFDPSMQQTVVDRRFREPSAKVDAIIYPWTNSFAASTNDPALLEKLANKARRMRR